MTNGTVVRAYVSIHWPNCQFKNCTDVMIHIWKIHNFLTNGLIYSKFALFCVSDLILINLSQRLDCPERIPLYCLLSFFNYNYGSMGVANWAWSHVCGLNWLSHLAGFQPLASLKRVKDGACDLKEDLRGLTQDRHTLVWGMEENKMERQSGASYFEWECWINVDDKIFDM